MVREWLKTAWVHCANWRAVEANSLKIVSVKHEFSKAWEAWYTRIGTSHPSLSCATKWSAEVRQDLVATLSSRAFPCAHQTERLQVSKARLSYIPVLMPGSLRSLSRLICNCSTFVFEKCFDPTPSTIFCVLMDILSVSRRSNSEWLNWTSSSGRR